MLCVNKSYPDDIGVLLELLAAGSVVADVSSDSGLTILSDDRLALPPHLERIAELVRFHGGILTSCKMKAFC